jgi:hypothetical protein
MELAGHGRYDSSLKPPLSAARTAASANKDSIMRCLTLLAVMSLPLFAGQTAADLPEAPAPQRPAAPGRNGVRGDDPEARRNFFLKQRMFPGDSLPGDGYALAAQAWLRARAETARLGTARVEAMQAGKSLAPDALPTGKWSEVGPSPILGNAPQSGLNFGNVAGRLSSITVHPSVATTLLAGASQGGLWRSVDGGTSWLPVGDNLPSLAIAAVRFAPSNPLIAYAATGDDDVSAWGMGVMKSVDGGLTWARIDNGSAANGIPDGTVLSKLEVAPDNANIVVAAGYRLYTATGTTATSAVFRTIDGGVTWSKATLPGAVTAGQVRALVIESGCPARLWGIDYVNKKLMRSTDSGATWSNATATGLPAFSSNTQISVVHSSCAGNATVFASVLSSSGLAGTAGYPGLYRSVDNGTTFARPGVAGPSGGCYAQCTYDHALLADPGDASRVYMIGRDLWASADGGATWSNVSAGFDNSNNYFGGNMHVDMHDLTINGTGAAAQIFVATDGGLFRYTVNGGTFSNLNGNLAISEVVDLAVRTDRPFWALAGLQDNGSIHYTGSNVWTARISGDGGAGGFLRNVTTGSGPLDGAFTTYVYNYSDRSSDGGLTWIGDFGWTSGPEFGNESSNFYAPWISTLGNNRIWHGTTSLWYYNFPSGPTWTKLANNPAGGGVLSVVAIHNPDAATLGPFYIASGGSFFQSSNGTTWNPRSTGLPGRTITDIEFNPAAPAQVWVTESGFSTTTGRLFYAADGGTTWVNKSGNLPNVPVNAVLIDPADRANTWYVATDAGVYGTTNGSAASPTWSAVGSNLPAAIVADLEIDGGRYLYAGTAGRSVWRIALPSSCAPPAAISNSFRLVKSGGNLSASWGNVSGADGYTIFDDGLTSGEFIRIAATSLDGAAGAAFTPPAPSRFYRVAPSGPCGEGPK